jgi:hypothetical protein
VPAFVSDLPAFDILEAIHEIENPTNSLVPGKHHEQGPFQFTLDAWRDVTVLPFIPQFTCNYDIAQAVALKRVRFIEEEFVKHGVRPSVFMVAVAWNAGLKAAIGGPIPESSVDYANRVVNLVNLMRDERK